MASAPTPDVKPKKPWWKAMNPTTYKSRMQLKVFSAIAVCVTVFIFIYIPNEVMNPLSEKISQAQAAYLKLGISVPIMFLLQWVIFAQDHLANGASLEAKFFRHYYPSSYARHKHDLAIPMASRLWFDLYNQWHSAEHSRHDKYKTNSYRTYSLRLIFYLTKIFTVFVVLAAVTTGLCYWPIKEVEFDRLLPGRIAGILFSLSLAFWLRSSNKILPNPQGNYYEKYEATGAYHKYKEYQGILWEYFEEEVLIPRKQNRNKSS
jgi:hypothetical protein